MQSSNVVENTFFVPLAIPCFNHSSSTVSSQQQTPFLYAECKNIKESQHPYHLRPKQSICDPTQSVGVFAPKSLKSDNLSLPSIIPKFPSIASLKFPCKIDINKALKVKTEKGKMNDGKRPFECAQCNKSFRNKSGLSNHKIIHRKIKPHKCKFKGCTKAFARSCDLTRHTRLHTGVKPFKCTFGNCTKAFTRSVQLRLHVMDHTGVRPHKCSICRKGFKTLQNMQIHMRIHTGERPYQCKQCKKTFTQSSSLRTHIKSIHLT